MNSTLRKLLLVPVLVTGLMGAGLGAALASEVAGTLTTGTSTPSYIDGSLIATVATSTTSTSTVAQAAPETPARTASRSAHRRAPYGGAVPASSSADPIIIIDGGSLATSAEMAGTGGGYDPAAERAIASARAGSGGGSSGISPSDAVAFNNSRNPLVNTDLSAAAADTSLGSAKVWTAVVLGLALLGLAGYAVNALMSYRRDNDL